MERRALLGGLILLIFAGCATSRPQPPSPDDFLEQNWDVDTCPVHGAKLLEAVEPLFIGKAHYSGDYYDARKKFPYAMTSMQHDGKEHNWRARYCPECRRGLDVWEKEHER